MALEAQITQPDGVLTTYHRIVKLSVIPNVGNHLEMASYVDRNGREREREYRAANDRHEYPLPAYPYVAGYRIELPYDALMTIDSAYERLKGIDAFSAAKSVPEDGSADQPKED